MSSTSTETALSVLILGEDRNFSQEMSTGLRSICAHGLAVTITDRIDEGLRLLRKNQFDIVLADHAANQLGQDTQSMRRLARLANGALILAISPAGSVSHAVGALEAGAHDFLVKPFSVDTLAKRLNALGQRHGKAKALALNESLAKSDFSGMFGISDQMQALFSQIEKVAKSDAPVFLTGEIGTGKRLCAEAIHSNSAQRNGEFVRVDCSAIPQDHIEEAIFTHARKKAVGGILFLDEISHLTHLAQSRLLNLLGAGTGIRVICATNRNPLELVQQRQLREDLFYRLHVLPICMPPLRQRPADIIPLAQLFLKEFGISEHRQTPVLNDQVRNQLVSREWPGNVRQLKNLMQRLIVSFDTDVIDTSLMTAADLEHRSLQCSDRARAPKNAPRQRNCIPPMWMQERKIIEDAIVQCDGNVALAASSLEISPSTIYRKRQQWDELEAKRNAA